MISPSGNSVGLRILINHPPSTSPCLVSPPVSVSRPPEPQPGTTGGSTISAMHLEPSEARYSVFRLRLQPIGHLGVYDTPAEQYHTLEIKIHTRRIDALGSSHCRSQHGIMNKHVASGSVAQYMRLNQVLLHSTVYPPFPLYLEQPSGSWLLLPRDQRPGSWF